MSISSSHTPTLVEKLLELRNVQRPADLTGGFPEPAFQSGNVKRLLLFTKIRPHGRKTEPEFGMSRSMIRENVEEAIRVCQHFYQMNTWKVLCHGETQYPAADGLAISCQSFGLDP